MFELTLLSIFRQSAGYIDRYAAQVEEAIAHRRPAHVIWVEGDSTDGTKEALACLADQLHATVTHVTLDLAGPYYPSSDVAERWTQLETVWNTALEQLKPSELCVCVESDLIWEWSAMAACIDRVERGVCDVAAPMLMKPELGVFYDVNGFSRHGHSFSSYPPHIPDWNGTDRLVECDTMGGMLVTTYEQLVKAQWRDRCRLHFAPGTRLMLDTQVSIRHP